MKKWIAVLWLATALGISGNVYANSTRVIEDTSNVVNSIALTLLDSASTENNSDLRNATDYVLSHNDSGNFKNQLLLRSSFIEGANLSTVPNERELFQKARDFVVSTFENEDYVNQVKCIQAYIDGYHSKQHNNK